MLVINTEDLTERCNEVNIIDCALEPEKLGSALVLAAQSAGAGASDPYWFQAMSDLFGAVLRLLKLRCAMMEGTREGREAITLRKLLDVILDTKDGERGIKSLMDDVKARLDPEIWSLNELHDAEIAFQAIESHLNNKDAGTVEQFVSQAFKLLRLSQYRCYSPLFEFNTGPRTTFYDQIIEEGKIVLVSLSPADELIARQLGSLIKGLFQKTVLSRLIRCNTGELKNATRPLILAAVEYSRIASEVPGTGMGDDAFLCQAYGLGCMVLITQSVSVLETAPLS